MTLMLGCCCFSVILQDPYRASPALMPMYTTSFCLQPSLTNSSHDGQLTAGKAVSFSRDSEKNRHERWWLQWPADVNELEVLFRGWFSCLGDGGPRSLLTIVQADAEVVRAAGLDPGSVVGPEVEVAVLLGKAEEAGICVNHVDQLGVLGAQVGDAVEREARQCGVQGYRKKLL